MRYIVEIETTKELKDFDPLIDFLKWFLHNLAGIGKNQLKSIDVRRGD